MTIEQTQPPTDYSALSSQERLALINGYRSRVIAGEKISDDELRTGLRLIRAERTARVSSRGKKADAAPQGPSKIGSMLDEI